MRQKAYYCEITSGTELCSASNDKLLILACSTFARLRKHPQLAYFLLTHERSPKDAARDRRTSETLRVRSLKVPGLKTPLIGAGVKCFSMKALKTIVFYTQITPREELLWIYSNNIVLDKTQLVVACGENKAGISTSVLYTYKKKFKK